MRRVFSRPGFAILALAVALVVYALHTWTTALPLFLNVVSKTDITVAESLSFGGMLLFAAFFNADSNTLTAGASSLLIGINVSLLVFFIRAFRTAPSMMNLSSGLAGGISSFLGLGCAACGSALIIPFLGTFGGAGLIALLPFGGAELGLLSITLLLISAIFLTRAINRPRVCPI